METNIIKRIYEIVRRIPLGHVATYGQIALMAGNPRLARVVGYALHRAPTGAGLPCHRVVNREGCLAEAFLENGIQWQRVLLEKEGVPFTKGGRVDLARCRWISDTRVQHEIDPVFDNRSHTLILGSFPSVKSREAGFYYGHPQNRFWRVLATVLSEQCPQTIEQKKMMLLTNGLALWDVVGACCIDGSNDQSIREVRPNDLSRITEQAPIRRVFANGTRAFRLYMRYFPKGIHATRLPSTSPANATCSLEALIGHWHLITTEHEE